MELGRYLSHLDWHIIDLAMSCEEKYKRLISIIETGLDLLMPEKRVKFHRNDVPWITENLKHLIKQRQRAFTSGNTLVYKFYRNKVNSTRKSCRAKYYASKVSIMKKSKPKEWWSEVKRISGMKSTAGPECLFSQLQLENIENMSPQSIANLINNNFLEPMKDYNPLTENDLSALFQDTPQDSTPTNTNIATIESVYNKLKVLNPSKAQGPNSFPIWILKEYADILSSPISNILNSSYSEQSLPEAWKRADITPIPKEKPVLDINKHLRPISLTPVLSKVAEEFMVERYIAPAILNISDPDQYGGIPHSSATLALISMVHSWAEATDGTGAAVRVLLFDYRKAFDLIDHRILTMKIVQLNIPRFVKNWVIDFLMNRKQRVKLSRDCYSEWRGVPSGVPQGTKLGPWLFILMINDLKLDYTSTWKYIDDTTISEIVPKNTISTIQRMASNIQMWSDENRLQLNTSKCKELDIYFGRANLTFPRVSLNNSNLDTVDHARVLGLTISKDLRWNEHVSNIIKKTNKRFYFIIQLKRAKVPVSDIVMFYTTCIRPVLEYSCQVYHFALPDYLSKAIERIQKRILSIIFPGTPYTVSLELSGLDYLYNRRLVACRKLFHEASLNPQHKLAHLIPCRHSNRYNIRRPRTFNSLKCKTNRFSNTFIPASVNMTNNEQ